MKSDRSGLGAAGLAVQVLVVLVAGSFTVMAQSPAASSKQATAAKVVGQPPSGERTELDDQYFREIYRDFYNHYKLGPEDQIALRVQGQPDYSLEQVTISPVGRIYHPLLGELDVAGMTVPKLTERLTLELSQYIRDPKVSLSLLTANSAKVGVLGDVVRPGIVIMSRPMTVLDAIAASGGVSDSGSKSDVTVLRQRGEGVLQPVKVNVKRILEGKASPEENIALQAGDTVIVHGNTRKKIANVTSMLGFGSFLGFIRGW
jgi:polysaccharide export outer membrane protein